LIPFFIVNGILTSLPVIWYNNQATLGIRIGTIPVEDFIYNGGLLLLAIMGYEWSNRKFFKLKKSTIDQAEAAMDAAAQQTS
jgi:hypothetical protein